MNAIASPLEGKQFTISFLDPSGAPYVCDSTTNQLLEHFKSKISAEISEGLTYYGLAKQLDADMINDNELIKINIYIHQLDFGDRLLRYISFFGGRGALKIIVNAYLGEDQIGEFQLKTKHSGGIFGGGQKNLFNEAIVPISTGVLTRLRRRFEGSET
jgi:hypothetical protein